jgi:hypothetical protein
VQAATFSLFAIGLFGWFVAYQTPFYFVLIVFLLGVLGFADGHQDLGDRQGAEPAR